MISDYELEFFVQSEGGMFIDDKWYPINKGDVVFRRPGQSTQAVMPYCCYLIFFDLSNNRTKDPKTYDFCEDNELEDFYLNPMLDVIPSVFHPHSGEKYHGLFDSVMKEYIHPSSASPMLMKAYTLQILYQLSLDATNPLNNNKHIPSPHGRLVKKAMEYMKENLHDPISLGHLAKLTALSPNYFHKVFSNTIGITPNDYLTKLRVEKAKKQRSFRIYVGLKTGAVDVHFVIGFYGVFLGIAIDLIKIVSPAL